MAQTIVNGFNQDFSNGITIAGLAIGMQPPSNNGWTTPAPYESIGTANKAQNLRFFAVNDILFAAGGNFATSSPAYFQKDVHVTGSLLCSQGSTLNAIVIGMEPPPDSGWTTPGPYESIGTAKKAQNLRLFAGNDILFAAGGDFVTSSPAYFQQDVHITGALLGSQGSTLNAIVIGMEPPPDSGWTTPGPYESIGTANKAQNLRLFAGNDILFAAGRNFATSSPAYFQQDVHVTGTLYAGNKQFLIDHPLDPLNKNLVYATVESPRYELLHRVTAKVVDGSGTVDLDEYLGMTTGTFAAISQNVEVFATSKNSWDMVKGEVEGGVLKISSSNKTASCSVMCLVISERNDSYIKSLGLTNNAGQLINEHDKKEPTAEELSEDSDMLRGKKGYAIHS